MIESQQDMLDLDPSAPMIALGADRGLTQFRAIVKRMPNAEAGKPAAARPWPELHERAQIPTIVTPPLGAITWPVMKSASAEASQATA